MFSEITSIRQWPFFSTIVLRTDAKRFRYEYVTPRRQRRALVRELRSRPDPATYPPRWQVEPSAATEKERSTFSSEQAPQDA